MRVVFFILMFLFGFALILNNLVNDYSEEVKIELRDDEENEFVEEASIEMIPNLNLKYTQKMTGKGIHIYSIGDYKFVYLKVTKEGYETYRGLKFLKKDRTYVITLKKTNN